MPSPEGTLKNQDATVTDADPRWLGLIALTAFVVGWMIGGGVFSLPQNMAAGATPAAILLGWLIAGAGMLALAFVYQNLATRKPSLDSGPYAYARAGFGDFVGFNAACEFVQATGNRSANSALADLSDILADRAGTIVTDSDCQR